MSKLIFIYCALVVSLNVACATASEESNGCVFNTGYYSENTYKRNSLVKHTQWNNDSKQAIIITSENDLVRINHWACRHVGLQAFMYLDQTSATPSVVIKKLKLLAKLSVEPADYKKIEAQLSKTALTEKSNTIIDFKFDNYSEFYAAVSYTDSTAILEIKFYRD